MKTSPSTHAKSRRVAASSALPRECSCSGSCERSEDIAVSAYYKAQARGFAPGHELDDWLQAEADFGCQARAQ